MLRAHVIRLIPTKAQAQYFARACGVARFAYNWALGEWNKQYAACKADPTLPKPNEGDLRKLLNRIKRDQFPWMLEVTKSAPQEAIRNLGVAYGNWFASLAGRRRGTRLAPPRFKRKYQHDCFKFDAFSVEDSRIRIPRLGWVRMREPLRFPGQLKGATVRRTAVGWEVAVLVDTDCVPDRCESQAAVGIDVGVNHLATLSNGEKREGPKALKTLLPRLRRLSRAHSRKQKGSANRRKAAQALARLHWRIGNIRADALHKLTHDLTRDYGWIAIEDLNVKGMMQGRIARSIADAGFGELRRQLTYKAAQRGNTLVAVDRFYPSSKQCNDCGFIFKDLPRGQTHWVCSSCGSAHDRDINAARNILEESIRMTTPGAGDSACGVESAGSGIRLGVKLSTVKQEVKHQMAFVPTYA